MKEEHVNHPDHYNQGGIECIDAMLSAFGTDAVKAFCQCNIFKYNWRAKLKNGREDMMKVRWYVDKWLELDENEEK